MCGCVLFIAKTLLRQHVEFRERISDYLHTVRSAIEHLRVDCFHVVEVIILVRRQYLSIRN